MFNNADGFISIFLNEWLQMKLDLKKYMKHNLVCIKFEISKEKSVEIKVMVLAWKEFTNLREALEKAGSISHLGADYISNFT